MPLVRYISHPNVVIDPDVPVPRWSLSEVGLGRARAMLVQPWVADIGRIVCSAETKAIQTAAVLAAHLRLEPEARPQTGETDRSATGYVPAERHDELAARFFAEPYVSVHGWERAVDAQARILAAVSDLLVPAVSHSSDTAIVGHGGVGTLLFCRLAGFEIDATHDQPATPAGHQGGHYWTYDLDRGEVLHPWRAIDDIEPT
ncbi:MAG: histidine phosphatase family protein [Acidimicrobiales bacterium]|nr:histidine phosphatase family protein [Acidimicrobiales bacterium]